MDPVTSFDKAIDQVFSEKGSVDGIVFTEKQEGSCAPGQQGR
jgi:hypothetical protein